MTSEPLSYRLRPDCLENFFGQEDILGTGKPLRLLIESDKIKSLVLFGPPGTGKSLLAMIIGKRTRSHFTSINAVTSNVSELRTIIGQARTRLEQEGSRSIVFIDEIHRFNKLQQDALLPVIEKGDIILIGATTQNPFFYLVPALQSRSFIFEFKPLKPGDLRNILEYALRNPEKGLGRENIRMDEHLKVLLIEKSAGDSRKLLNFLELAVLMAREKDPKNILITEEILQETIQQRYSLYDRDSDLHYNIISAFIKSVRGSDPDAAVYYLARMLEGGEDPLFVCRRLVILASEDIGNADPMGLIHAQACFDAVSHIGMPEARIIMAQTTIYLATAPKSNASYLAINKAMEDIARGEVMDVPEHLKSTGYKGAEELKHGKEYRYPHDHPYHYTRQRYLLKDKVYYEPTELGFEKKIKLRLDFLKKL